MMDQEGASHVTCDTNGERGEIEATTYFILNRTFAQQKDRHHTYGKFALTINSPERAIMTLSASPFIFQR